MPGKYMTDDLRDMRAKLESEWSRLPAGSSHFEMVERFKPLIRLLPEDERVVASRVIVEWLWSTHGGRSDLAKALFSLSPTKSSVISLEWLIGSLESTGDPRAAGTAESLRQLLDSLRRRPLSSEDGMFDAS